ncbi:MAG: hypothetical protein IKF83_02535 [Clostridia bacterium]|nr:hypothetical protein [Clostridia bacterium]
MKAKKFFTTMVLMVTLAMLTFAVTRCGTDSTSSVTSSIKEEKNATEVKNADLKFDKFYMVMPEMNIRANPEKPEKIDTLQVGHEVQFIRQEGDWATFSYEKDGEERTGCTWCAAIAPGVRIHLLEDEFIFRKPGGKTDEIGSITMWREPSDPDLIILWQEDDGWYYVVSMQDCRSGYMSPEAKFVIVE